MNKRIRELIDQVGIKTDHSSAVNKAQQIRKLEMLTESIINECFDVVLNDWRFSDSKSVIRYAHSRANKDKEIEQLRNTIAELERILFDVAFKERKNKLEEQDK